MASPTTIPPATIPIRVPISPSFLVVVVTIILDIVTGSGRPGPPERYA
jgi:hypothetical protein